MKVGFYIQRVASAPGFENVVSAHVQLPVKTMNLLRGEGHEVQLITTEFGENRTLPDCVPTDVTIHKVIYGSYQGDDLVMFTGNKSGLRPLKLIKQLFQLKHIIEKEKFDILHFSGSNRIVYLLGLLSLISVLPPIVLTINTGQLSEHSPAKRFFWKKVSAVITSTEFFKRKLAAEGITAVVIKHGTPQDFKQEIHKIRVNSPRHRVLFWRDPSIENGTDVCLKVFEQLAPKYPGVSFDLAVRPHWKPVAGIKKLSAAYDNVSLYEFPYERGITIAELLAESICVLLPFRELSTHPQISALESLQASTAVVTTALDSNFELIESGRNGYLMPVGDVQKTTEIVKMLLDNRKHAARIGECASLDIARKWNWDNYVSQLLSIYYWTIDNVTPSST